MDTQKKIDIMIEEVCKDYGITTEEIKNKSRERKYSEPRAVALSFIKASKFGITDRSIGEIFGMTNAPVFIIYSKTLGRTKVDIRFHARIERIGNNILLKLLAL